MAALTLKNLPDDLLRELRAAAEQDRRSLNQQIIHLLDAALRDGPKRETARTPGVKAQVAAWRQLAGRWESDVRATETARLVKRRTPGRKVDP